MCINFKKIEESIVYKISKFDGKPKPQKKPPGKSPEKLNYSKSTCKTHFRCYNI